MGDTITFSEALLNEALVIIQDPKIRQWASEAPVRAKLLAFAKVQTDYYGLDADPMIFSKHVELKYNER